MPVSHTPGGLPPRRSRELHVRLTPQEHLHIRAEAALHRISVSELLRRRYLNTRPIALTDARLLSELGALHADLRRIGNLLCLAVYTGTPVDADVREQLTALTVRLHQALDALDQALEQARTAPAAEQPVP